MLTAVARVTDNFIGTSKAGPIIIVPIFVVMDFRGTMRMVLRRGIRISDDKNTDEFNSWVVMEKYAGWWESRHEIAVRTSSKGVIEIIEIKPYNVKLVSCEMQLHHQLAQGRACLNYDLILFYRQDGIYKVHHTRDLSACCSHTFHTPPMPGCRLIFTYEYDILDIQTPDPIPLRL
jgi:hypothetical protein